MPPSVKIPAQQLLTSWNLAVGASNEFDEELFRSAASPRYFSAPRCGNFGVDHMPWFSGVAPAPMPPRQTDTPHSEASEEKFTVLSLKFRPHYGPETPRIPRVKAAPWFPVREKGMKLRVRTGKMW